MPSNPFRQRRQRRTSHSFRDKSSSSAASAHSISATSASSTHTGRLSLASFMSRFTRSTPPPLPHTRSHLDIPSPAVPRKSLSYPSLPPSNHSIHHSERYCSSSPVFEEEPLESDVSVEEKDTHRDAPMRLYFSHGPITRVRANYWFLHPTAEQLTSLQEKRVVILTSPPHKLAYQIQSVIAFEEDPETKIFWANPVTEPMAPPALLVALPPHCPPSQAILAFLGLLGVGSSSYPAVLPASYFKPAPLYVNAAVQTSGPGS